MDAFFTTDEPSISDGRLDTRAQRAVNAAFIVLCGLFLSTFDCLLNGPSTSSLFVEIYSSSAGMDASLLGYVGYLVGGLCLICFPDFFKRNRARAIYVALALSVGSILLHFLTLGHSVALGIAGIFIAGLMLTFSKTLFFYCISLYRNVAVLVMSVALEQIGMIILLTWIGMLPEDSQLVLLLTSLVLCVCALLAVVAVSRFVRFEVTSARIIKTDMTWPYLIAQMIVINMVTALFRTFGTLNAFPTTAVGIAFEVGLYILIPVIGYYVFIRNRSGSSDCFRTALLILILGMFLLLGQSTNTWVLSEQSSRQLAHFFRSFAFISCWCVIVSTSWVNPEKSMRVYGIGIVAFCLTSILWMIVFGNMRGIIPVLIGAFIYLCFLAVSKFFPSTLVVQKKDLQQLEQERLQRIASEYGLSNRESEIFLLLSQGRSRHAIAEALYLSEGTVKGYIGRIYAKMEVSSKDEFLQKVRDYDNGRGHGA
ncbi:MAG: response regulator transcription factor [Eggerthellaceae bacterium]|nr:response regulator transcription factor [Eggerthellaceae bacterium]